MTVRIFDRDSARTIDPMRIFLLSGITLLVAVPASVLHSAGDDTASASKFVLPEIGDGEGAVAAKFSEAQISFVRSWIRRLVPECPDGVLDTVAVDFLDELRRRHPGEADRLLSAEFRADAFTSMLLRQVAAALGGAAHAGVREQVALRRVALLLPRSKTGTGPAPSAAEMLDKIRAASTVQHRRVLEGRLDDDEMLGLMARTRQPAEESKPVAQARPKELTVADIVSEFARRNQTGAAVAKLQAYTIEGQLTDPTGQVSELLLYKMRPDRFRLVMRRAGRTQSILAGDGDRFWALIPGQPVRVITPKEMGERRHMGEFMGPLLQQEGFVFERLPDGIEGDRKCYRVAVRRKDGSGYVTRIDAETFQEVARENADQSIVRYSEHQEIAGIMLAHREEVTDAKGGKMTFDMTRITDNPGLIRDFFQPPPPTQPSYLEFEKFAPVASASSTPARP